MTIKRKVPQSAAHRPFRATSFEHYMYADDRIDFPMTFFIRLSFAGVLEIKKFEKALLDALPNQLLFQSLLNNESCIRGGKLHWIPFPVTQLPYMDVEPIGTPFNWSKTGRHINLQKEIGLRFFIRTGEDKTILTMQIHHASSDAIGALEFIEDVMKYYHSKPGTISKSHHGNLGQRGRFHLTATEKLLRSGKDLGRAVKFFSKSPNPLASGKHPDHLTLHRNGGHPYSKVIKIEDEEFLRLKAYAKIHQVTLNDLFLAELFITIAQFNTDKKKDGDCFRISMPINMRDSSHTETPSANIVSMCFLDRIRRSIKDDGKLMAGIANETRTIKKHRLGLALLRTLRRFSQYAGGLNFLVTPRKPFLCCATVVLSNLGRVFDGSDVFNPSLSPVLETVELLPPLRPHTHATLGVASFNGRLSISMHYNELEISDKNAEGFLEFFKSRLLGKSEAVDVKSPMMQ